MIALWVTLIIMGSLFIIQSYVIWHDNYTRCQSANGTLYHDRTDYICIKTKAVIPLK
jgi:hypothetical protein